jgi:ABC-type amino acid transport substrate-binding protein
MKILVSFLAFIFLSFSDAKVLRISGVEGGPHIIYDASNPRPSGLVPEFVDLYLKQDLKKKYDMDIEWHQAPTARLLRELETNDLDLLCFLSKNPEREKIYAFSEEPFIVGRNSLIVRKDFVKGTELVNLDAFKNKSIGAMSGVTLPASFAENSIHIFPITGSDITDRVLSLVEKKRVDGIFVHQNQVAEFFVRKNNDEDTLKVVTLPGESFKVYLAFRKSLKPELKVFIENIFFKHRDQYTKMMSKK